ncbi:hypothetical protein BB559_001577 [Furculomyces boomerangus]|uniref:Type 1 phosphatases regulator n=2 Tax=Harpellales TaxID=61421 RepID=A0A2T9XYG5_9FUNG|nr:hypothetical protein BB559_007199 [Furculomyces boomerangus]PVU98438.1 hypothetical protein BB559_001577 [Furculomyces boomerangus]PWA01069.1 hypothetical protein BB558_002857 [Smittium angustum]
MEDVQFQTNVNQQNTGSYNLGDLVSPNIQSHQQSVGVGTQIRSRSQANPGNGSRTITVQTNPEGQFPQETPAVLYLRGQPTEVTNRRQSLQVRWTEDTVDNENMNKKKSKICCIFKKQRSWSDSEMEDSESEYSSCGCSDDEPNEYERQPKRRPKQF